ncbi:Trm112 family protein [Salinisphaera sp. Q1T1-3]|uniref:Trm112 family protein n=1 Tax=Salinisphaera sp. Q1T1-3 TaxID=2321229 RepID=UPI000E730B61|nr:Trm112 family protein [Salinisphaera sp. Q1T1-3]RJS93362.1 Trm112 family protein [Salinisphaera sp. Q1T1-3]
MDKQLLEILVCPVSGLSVSPADSETIDALNADIAAGRARHADDSVVDERVVALLVTRDGATGYRVDDGIPVMLPERGIALRATA